MTAAEQSAMMAENVMLKEENNRLGGILSAICKVYDVVRPVLKFLRIFAFIKSGGKLAIDAATAVLDESCSVK